MCYLQKTSLYLPEKEEVFSKHIVQYSNSVKKLMLRRNTLFRSLRIDVYDLEVLEYLSLEFIF